ncbi:MAG: PhoH family protein [Candidatus Hydrothermales bacterium]
MEIKVFTLKPKKIREILGVLNQNLKVLQTNFSGKISVRGEEIKFEGTKKEFERFRDLLKELEAKAQEGKFFEPEEIIEILNYKNSIDEKDKEKNVIVTPKKIVVPKTENQILYVEALRKYPITFSIGPAGTGKTYLAVAVALESLMEEKVERIILTRPAVEAGESLGFLPGSFQEKVDPYLRPLYDALFDMMPYERIKKLMSTGVIEIAPLAYMRGRTLSNAFVILDEAQNTNYLQMKMFLTRMGLKTKIAITGDVTQIDLKEKEESGLLIAEKILKDLDGIKFIYLGPEDIIRHPIVKSIIIAYEKYERKKREGKNS